MKKTVTVAATLVLLLSIIYVSCSKSSSSNNNTPASPNTVSIANMAFTQSTITVPVGTTVTWKNNDNMTHTVTADDDSFDSGNIGSGRDFAKTFSVVGTFNYHCTIHPTMTGKVIVQ